MGEIIAGVEATCRVCLQANLEMVDIYEKVEDMGADLCKLLEQCGGLTVNKNDSYSKLLCKDCTTELLIAANFRMKCARTLEILAQVNKELDAAKCQEEELEMLGSGEETATYQMVQSNDENGTMAITFNNENINTTIVTVQNASAVPVETNLERDTIHSSEYDFDSIIEEDYGYSPEMTNETPESNEGDLKYCVDFEEVVTYTDISNDANESESTLETAINQIAIVKEANQEKVEAFVCDVCGASFVQALNLKRHMEKSHVILKFYICTDCDYCFSREETYINHQNATVAVCRQMREKQSNTRIQRIYKCAHCGKEMKSASAVAMHERTHTGERPFQCDICPKSFKTQGALDLHMKRHFNITDYSCHICKKKFYEASNLNIHLRTHTGEKPHKCTICGRAFTRVFLLKSHMYTHSGEKPYRCEICNRAFSQSGDLNYHIKTHTKQAAFKCSLCSKSFIKRYALNLHMKKHCVLAICDDVELQDNLGLPTDYNSVVAEAAEKISGDYNSPISNPLEHDIRLSDLI